MRDPDSESSLTQSQIFAIVLYILRNLVCSCYSELVTAWLAWCRELLHIDQIMWQCSRHTGAILKR